MSRTPEQIVNKKAVTVRRWVWGFGGLSAFIAWGAYLNSDVGGCVALGVVAFILFWIGGKIRTVKTKQGEVGVYG